jgi:hypothetical protein
MFGNLSHHLHKAKQHVKTIADFGQKAWSTIGKVVKHGSDALGKASSFANGFKGLHPIVDDGIAFLNSASGAGNKANDLYNQANETKDRLQKAYKDPNANTTMVPYNPNIKRSAY